MGLTTAVAMCKYLAFKWAQSYCNVELFFQKTPRWFVVFHVSNLVIGVFFGWLSGDGTEFWANATQWTPRIGGMKCGWYGSASDLQGIWIQWVQALPKLQTISIPQWFGFCRDDSLLELHCFNDVISVGYGVVCYIRVVKATSRECKFVLGRYRGCPIKTITIPRLELSAVTLAIKLARMISKELEVEFCRTVYWIDPTTVLRYIVNRSRLFSVFVANRLCRIHSSSQISQRRYVKSKRKPADLASRGAMTVGDCGHGRPQRFFQGGQGRHVAHFFSDGWSFNVNRRSKNA